MFYPSLTHTSFFDDFDYFAQEMNDWSDVIKSFDRDFAWAWWNDRQTLGTPIPLSSFVAKELAKQILNIQPDSPPQYILEAGPGTGAITKYIIKHLRPSDKLVLVEMNKNLFKRLEVIFKTEIDSGQIEVYNAPLQDWNPENRKFDFIISGIPPQSLPSKKTLDKILDSIVYLAKDNCYASFVEYAFTEYWCYPFKGEIIDAKWAFFDKHRIEPTVWVWKNLGPPGQVTHCRINQS